MLKLALGLSVTGVPDSGEASEQCRFTDCRHVGDEGCAVERLVEPARLASYRKLLV